jgi:hypothetical protein
MVKRNAIHNNIPKVELYKSQNSIRTANLKTFYKHV